MGDGARSGFFKEEATEFKMQMQNLYRAFVHNIILCYVQSKGKYTLGIRLGHSARARAPVLGSSIL